MAKCFLFFFLRYPVVHGGNIGSVGFHGVWEGIRRSTASKSRTLHQFNGVQHFFLNASWQIDV